jgi:carbon monoxide dehydrogenase subunit G
MRLTGSYQFDAPAEDVYRRLLDPDVLRVCMPGCERLDRVANDKFELTFTVPVPAIKGEYSGTVELLEQRPPSSFRMRIRATGKSGFVNADAHMRIEPNGATGATVQYDADAQVGGPAASVGQRVLTGISRRQVDQLMRCLERERPSWLVRALAWLRAKLGRGRRPEARS